MNWNIKDTASLMHIEEKYHVPYFVFDNLKETGIVRHGFSTRLGGVSTEHLSSLNFSYTRETDPGRVKTNFCRMAAALGFDVDSLVLSDQTHTTNIRIVTEEDRGKGFNRPLDYHDIDGLITNTPGLTLATFYADCVPLFFVDPVHKAIGLSHSGWKGTVNRMGRATLEKMQEAFGTDPGNVQAAIAPSICQDCYEVSEDVASVFIKEFSANVDERLVYRKPNGKYQLNLWRANEIVLTEAGIKPENLAITNICTCCNPDYLYSHRASNGVRGNLGAFLQLL